jgi:hypothetical protein
MSSEKIIGYILLILGVLAIIFPSYSVYQVFTNRAKPVQLFKFEGVNLDFGKLVEQPESSKNLKQELIAPEVLNDPMNLAAHVFLMGFLASSGLKIASIGVQLLRPIKVNVKDGSPS